MAISGFDYIIIAIFVSTAILVMVYSLDLLTIIRNV